MYDKLYRAIELSPLEHDLSQLDPWRLSKRINRALLETYIVPSSSYTMYGHGLGTGYLGRRGYRKITSEEAVLEAVDMPRLYKATAEYIKRIVIPLVTGDRGTSLSIDDEAYLGMAIESAIMIAGIAHVAFALPSPFKGYIIESTGRRLAETIMNDDGRGEKKRDSAGIAVLMPALHAFINKILTNAWGIDAEELGKLSIIHGGEADKCIGSAGKGYAEKYMDYLMEIPSPALRCNIVYTVDSMIGRSIEENETLSIFSIHYPAGIYVPIYHVFGHTALVFLARALTGRCTRENPYCSQGAGTSIAEILDTIRYHVFPEAKALGEDILIEGIGIPLGIAAMILLGPYYTSGLVKLASLIEFFNPVINANTIDSVSRSIIMSGAVTGLSYNYRDLVTIPDIVVVDTKGKKKLYTNIKDSIKRFIGENDEDERYELVARSLMEPFIIHWAASGDTYFLLPYVIEARDAIKLVELYTSMLFYDRLVARHNITVQVTHEYYTRVFQRSRDNIYNGIVEELYKTINSILKGEHPLPLLRKLHISLGGYVKRYIDEMEWIGLEESVVRKLIDIRRRTKIVYEYHLCGIKGTLIKEGIMLDSFSAVNPEQVHDQMKLSERIGKKLSELIEKKGSKELREAMQEIGLDKMVKVALVPHEGDLVRPAEFKSIFLVKHVIGEREYSVYTLNTMLNMLRREKGISPYIIVYVIIPELGEKNMSVAELFFSHYDEIDRFLREALNTYVELCIQPSSTTQRGE